jgi:hypothetical protein
VEVPSFVWKRVQAAAILDRFTVEERLLEIKQQRPGDRSDIDGELSYSTASSYLSHQAGSIEVG